MNVVTLNLEVNKYWDSIKNAPSEIKLKLITLLSQSLSGINLLKDNRMETKEELLKKICGSWSDTDSDEEIIKSIRENRTAKSPVEF